MTLVPKNQWALNNVVRNPKATSQEVELVLGDDARPKDHPCKSHIFSVDQYRDADYRLGQLRVIAELQTDQQ
jgi:hypothetical protein